MLIEFSVENFRSFKELQTFTMVAANIRSKPSYVDEQNVATVGKYKLLRTKAIYGANASGKSNLVKAFMAFRHIVRYSVKEEKLLEVSIDEKFLLSTDTDNKPIFFEMLFLDNNIEYRYGFEIKDELVVSEWLLGKPKRSEVQFFVREGMDVKVNTKVFKDENVKMAQVLASEGENNIVRPNSLFLTAVASLGGKLAKRLVRSITNIQPIAGFQENNHLFRQVIEKRLDDSKGKEALLNLLKTADLAINDLEVKPISKEDLVGHLPDEVIAQIGDEKIMPNLCTKRSKYNTEGKKVGEIMQDIELWEVGRNKEVSFLSGGFIRNFHQRLYLSD